MILVGIVAPILIFLLSANFTFAYFTATTQNDKTQNLKSGVIRIAFAQKNAAEMFGTGALNGELLPGDSITASATIQNHSNGAVFVIVSFKVIQTLNSVTTDLVNSCYAYDASNNLIPITFDEESNTYSPYAFIIDAPSSDVPVPTKNFTLTQDFDFYETTNSFNNAVVSYSIHAYAIQEAALSAEEATRILMERFT